MGKENIVVYNENVARDIVKDGNFRDYSGNKIGTIENLDTEYFNVFFQLAKWSRGETDDTEVKDAVNHYKATKYCYRNRHEGDTSGMDEIINKKLENYLYDIDVRV